MPTPPIRCFESNTSVGQWFPILDAIKTYLQENPPRDGELTLSDYYDACGITGFSRMHIFTWQDDLYLNEAPIKDQ